MKARTLRFPFRRALAPLVLAFIAACSDSTTEPLPGREREALRDLVDSSQPTAPVPGFYFLVPTLAPPPASFSGTFDAALSPVIDICALAGDSPKSPAACAAPPLVSLSAPQQVKLDTKGQNYNANWTANVAAGRKLRAFVSAGGRVLGYVDLQVIKKAKDAVSAGFVPVVTAKPFLFKFRIETGIAGAITVAPPTATLRDADTPGEAQLFTASVLDLHGAPLGGKSVAWSTSDAAIVSMTPAASTTSGAGQATSTAATVGRVGTSTDVTVSATVHGLAATATITVLPTPGRPIAVSDAYGVVSGQVLTIAAPGVLGNDFDADGDPLTVSGVTDGVDHGTLALAADGSFTYTPAAGFIGTDAFTYTAVDPATHVSLPATVTIEVITPSDLGPVANDDHYAVMENRKLTVAASGFLGNDADPDGQSLQATLVIQTTAHGTLSAFGDGSFTYTPVVGYTGTDAFKYRMQDASGNTAEATVNIEVLVDPDKAPIAVDDHFVVMTGGVLTSAAPGFLGNDADPDGGALQATVILQQPAHGTLSAFGGGNFTYTPTAGFAGPDTFKYRMQNARGYTAEATVTIDVLAATTTGPIATADSYVAFDGSVLQVPASGFLANDIDAAGEAVSATLIVDNVDHGTLAAFPDGRFSYTPVAGYAGADAFTYRMRNASGVEADAIVTIQVSPDPDAQPIGNADTYTTFTDHVLDVPAAGFLGNDMDPDGAAVTATLIADNVDHGTLVAYPNGNFIYTPAPGFTGTDSFAYRMQDASGNGSGNIVVTLDVRPDPNQPPVGLPDRYMMVGGTSLTIPAPGFIGNDVDPEGEAITATLIADNVDHGTLVAYPGGNFTYTPTAGFAGTDTFLYRMQDASGHQSGNILVTIEVLDPALVASSLVATGTNGPTMRTSRTSSAQSAGTGTPLPVGTMSRPGASRGAKSDDAATRPAVNGATPLSTRPSAIVAPTPRSRIDPATFAGGKVPLPGGR